MEKKEIYIYIFVDQVHCTRFDWMASSGLATSSSGQRALISRCRACIFTIFPACLFLLDVESNRLDGLY